MTYGEIRTRLSQLLPEVSVELIDGWISDRYFQILDRLAWQRRDTAITISTAIDADILKLPADCRALKSVRGPLGPLEYWDATKHVVGTVKGTPQAWRPVWDSATNPPQQQIQLWPIADAVYPIDVEYTAEESTFAASDPDTATTLLPWMRPSAINAGVYADGLAYKENFAAADRQEVRYESYIRDMIRTEAKRTPAKQIEISPKYLPSRYLPARRRVA